MKLTSFLLTIGLFSFSTSSNDIPKCYINFNKASKLSMSLPERLPSSQEKVVQLSTEKGNVAVSRIDGYRINYNNKSKSSFYQFKS